VRILNRLVWRVLDWIDYRIWDVRLRVVDALYGATHRQIFAPAKIPAAVNQPAAERQSPFVLVEI
jgi:hypothetical protein